MLESALHKLKQVSEKYSSKSALGTFPRRHEPFKLLNRVACRAALNSRACFPAADYPHVSQQVKQLEEDGGAALTEVAAAESIMGRVLSAWEAYGDCLSSLQAWLEQDSIRMSHGHRAEVLGTLPERSQSPPTVTDLIFQVTAECLAEWESRKARLTEAGTFLMEFTDPQTSRTLEEELRRFNQRWTEFTRTNPSVRPR